MSRASPIRVGLISLGCAKNLVDSELMLGALRRAGLEFSADLREAEVVIVNTCGFVEAAKAESIQAVLRANQLRQTGRCRALIVAGCLTQRYPQDLQRELPEADAIVGLNEVPRMGAIVREVLERIPRAPGRSNQVEQASCLSQSDKMDRQHACPTPALYWSGPARFVPDFGAPRVRLTPRHFAYVKVAEGCNHPCSFCSIPRIRGRHRSRPPGDLLQEIESLVRAGVREINLISQDTTYYGKDLEEWKGGRMGEWRRSVGPVFQSSNLPSCQPSLASLLRAIQRIDGEFWVRLLYTHPAHWSDELIATIAACDKVCRYVDMPLQHINDAMLRRMRRETSSRQIRDLVARLRAGLPGLALRTTFIVGFPGETAGQFAELLEFIEAARFERVGIFTYSAEDHTPAATMAGQVPGRLRQQRYRRAMARQQQVSRAVQRRLVGQQLRVLVEKPVPALPPALRKLGESVAGPWYQARSHADAPEIDGTVYLAGAARVGEFATVLVTAAAEYDLIAAVVA